MASAVASVHVDGVDYLLNADDLVYIPKCAFAFG